MGRSKLLILLGIAAALMGCESDVTPSHEAQLTPEFIRAHDAPATLDFYRMRVQPIFQQDCYRCHGGMNRKGELNFQTKAGMMKGGKHGPAIALGDVANSLLLKGIRREDGEHVKPMPPPPRQKMPDADIAVIERWVKAGAIMPDSRNGK